MRTLGALSQVLAAACLQPPPASFSSGALPTLFRSAVCRACGLQRRWSWASCCSAQPVSGCDPALSCCQRWQLQPWPEQHLQADAVWSGAHACAAARTRPPSSSSCPSMRARPEKERFLIQARAAAGRQLLACAPNGCRRPADLAMRAGAGRHPPVRQERRGGGHQATT